MSAWIATALAVATAAMSAITVVNAGSCGPGGTHNCFNLPTTIDFSSVPEISNQIVSEEKPSQKNKTAHGRAIGGGSVYGPDFWGKSATRTNAGRWLFLVIGVTGRLDRGLTVFQNPIGTPPRMCEKESELLAKWLA